ncbi:Mg-dependent DNase [Cenarchaeum symbiosum A]|uniref:Mg-dependent DNase n=1 Tax=Cenarchaeum symbiosum (strain A) TaxID=414004 RepID=A0RTN5_CENSY|nr:Mg-dependent DNase [Cenarchaeum symbiosum A]
MHRIYDAHVHLSDPEYEGQLDSMITGMKRTGITACCVSMDEIDSRAVLDMAIPGTILPFVGIHPERAPGDPEAISTMLDEYSGSISGIGEIGLDPSYCTSDEDTKNQVDTFKHLLDLAEKHSKPVSIHSRGSLDDILDMLESYSLRACLHWFDGNKRSLKRALDMGLYVSYGPLAVYAAEKRSLLSRTDRDRILVETDGPVRFSRCFGRRPAHPSMVPSVIFAASAAIGTEYGETCRILEANSRRYLGV